MSADVSTDQEELRVAVARIIDRELWWAIDDRVKYGHAPHERQAELIDASLDRAGDLIAMVVSKLPAVGESEAEDVDVTAEVRELIEAATAIHQRYERRGTIGKFLFDRLASALSAVGGK